MKLKKYLFLLLLLLFPAVPFAGGSESGGVCVDESTTVVVCMGGSSKRYHKTEYCRGLNNCQGGLKRVTLEEAKRAGRTACRICY